MRKSHAADAAAAPPPGPQLPPLPPAEVRRRRRELVIGLALGAAVVALALFEREIADFTRALPIDDAALFFFLSAVNVILIGVLGFVIARNFVKLVFERRRGLLGSHLNAKFVVAFVLIATLPTAALFVVANFFITSSINTWFSLQVDHALEESRRVADAYYRTSAESALLFAERIATGIGERGLLAPGREDELQEFVESKQREYHLGLVEVFPVGDGPPVTAINPDVPAANFSRREGDVVASALAGEAVSRVEPGGGSSDVIRGAVPVLVPGPRGRAPRLAAAVVVNYRIPVSLTRRVAAIRATLDEYRTLQPNAGHLRGVYQLELLLVFLVIVMVAAWWGFRMAKGVTGPISALAQGTAEVAAGNLDVVVQPTADDEMGTLVQSFNAMTRDLRDYRRGLVASNAEIEQRRRYMEIVLRNVGAGVVSLDADGRISTINPSAQRLLAIAPGAAPVGRTLDEAVGRSELLDLLRDLARPLRAGVRESLRRQVAVPLGDEMATLLVTMNLLRDEDGGTLGTVIVFDDYSQLVKVQRMEAWREVARRIAHEIKNPLTPIQLSAQRLRRRFRERLAAEGPERKVFDECLDAITTQVGTLSLLVNEFSNFARLPAASPRPDDLNAIVSEAVAHYAGTDDVVFKTDLQPGLPAVEVDRDQIRRVLTNLIDNAIAASREWMEREGVENGGAAGQIELRTVYDAPLQTARVEVADHGTGIPPEDRRRVFEPYFSTKPHGTGLGLAIVSRIVADHRGYVRIHPNRPRGTRVIVELPLRSA
jgi:two-component system nitrogen regulation sensor histidine kinase NtrY